MTPFQQIKQAKKEAPFLALLSTEQKNQILRALSKKLKAHQKLILSANREDLAEGAKHYPKGIPDRLELTPERLFDIAESLDQLALLPDPVGQVIDRRVRPNGLQLSRVRVPIGVIGILYEARPNVTIDAAALCLKSGNAVLLKGGHAARHTNLALVRVIHESLEANGVSPHAVQLIDTRDRAVMKKILQHAHEIDCIIPRGGKGLIDFVRKNSRIPVIETGASVVHLYIDSEADLKKAIAVTVNAKTRRVSICNALDVLLVHAKIAQRFLPKLSEALIQKEPLTELRADPKLHRYFKNYPKLKKINSKDFDTEFLDYVLAIRTVENPDEALAHIAKHSLRHSEGIVTENKETAERFLRTVDAACVYHNASTQFSDGGEFGLGSEIGISTQKLHARGPFALEGLTTYKWVIHGDGQIRS